MDTTGKSLKLLAIGAAFGWNLHRLSQDNPSILPPTNEALILANTYWQDFASLVEALSTFLGEEWQDFEIH